MHTVGCRWVEQRLVALRDAELSPGETHFVLEHLETCARCSARDRALLDATPHPTLVVPPAIQAALEASVDRAIREALLQTPPPVERSTRWSRWLRRDRDLPNASILLYGFLLAACLGWGLSNWLSARELRNEIQAFQAHSIRSTPAGGATATEPVEIPSEQYRPASFETAPEDEPWR